MPLGFLLVDQSEPEQVALLASPRAAVFAYGGTAQSEAIAALTTAIRNPALAAHALAEVDRLPALLRRRVLATLGRLHSEGPAGAPR
jgi:hypothetical protein